MKKNGLAPKRIAKWKTYSLLIAAISIGSIAYGAATAYISYPTAEHREVSRQLTEMSQSAGINPEEYEKLEKSDEYNKLLNDSRTVYSNRMGIASGIIGLVLGAAVVVAVYRYLRRQRITTKAVGATVLINTVATIIVIVPSIYISQWVTGTPIDSLTMILLIAASPFMIGFTMLITFFIAKVTEWHYSRSHGFIEE